MPELPEVETIRRDLKNALTGLTLDKLEVRDPRILTRGTVLNELGALRRKIQDVERQGKYILFRIEASRLPQGRPPQRIVVHLRMTGQLIYGSEDPKSRAVFRFKETSRVLNFLDTRRFGEIFLSSRKLPVSLGQDPLARDADWKGFHREIRSRRAPIKTLLMNQAILSGLGNIYATEALFQARIRPSRRAGRLSGEEARNLFQAIRRVLKEGIRHRGSSIKNYLDSRGRPGEMARYLRVYDREGKPCARCGTPVRYAKLSGRGSYWCPRCQN